MIGCHQTREERNPAFADHEIMEAPAEAASAHLVHTQAAAFCAVRLRKLLQADDAMGEAVQTIIVSLLGQVVEQQHRAAALGEEMLESNDLPAVAQCALRQ